MSLFALDHDFRFAIDFHLYWSRYVKSKVTSNICLICKEEKKNVDMTTWIRNRSTKGVLFFGSPRFLILNSICKQWRHLSADFDNAALNSICQGSRWDCIVVRWKCQMSKAKINNKKTIISAGTSRQSPCETTAITYAPPFWQSLSNLLTYWLLKILMGRVLIMLAKLVKIDLKGSVFLLSSVCGCIMITATHTLKVIFVVNCLI